MDKDFSSETLDSSGSKAFLELLILLGQNGYTSDFRTYKGTLDSSGEEPADKLPDYLLSVLQGQGKYFSGLKGGSLDKLPRLNRPKDILILEKDKNRLNPILSKPVEYRADVEDYKLGDDSEMGNPQTPFFFINPLPEGAIASAVVEALQRYRRGGRVEKVEDSRTSSNDLNLNRLLLEAIDWGKLINNEVAPSYKIDAQTLYAILAQSRNVLYLSNKSDLSRDGMDYSVDDNT
jgi:hypothetical protein